MPWSNGSLNLFHGTTNQSINANIPQNNGRINVGSANHGIALNKGNPNAEFGPGFYTTTNIKQARDWANIMSKRHLLGPNPRIAAVVLGFALDRIAMSRLSDLVFVRGTDDYWDLVEHSRSGGTFHMPPRNHYDVVYGPVSLRGDRRLMPGSDQVSFHTDAALQILPAPIIVAYGSPVIP